MKEIDIMIKILKYKIFKILYVQIQLKDQLFLIEILLGHDLSKLKNFCGENFRF